MAGTGGRKATTFKKGEGRPKGVKNKRTLVKETIGVENWDQLAAWMEGEGLKQRLTEMKKLKGKSFTVAYDSLLEYIKPKLNRTTVAGDKENPLVPPIIQLVAPAALPVFPSSEADVDVT